MLSQAVNEWITKHTSKPCSECGEGVFSIPDTFDLPGSPSPFPKAPTSAPKVVMALECDNCGHLRFFSQKKALKLAAGK
jgi:hypothetical protein